MQNSKSLASAFYLMSVVLLKIMDLTYKTITSRHFWTKSIIPSAKELAAQTRLSAPQLSQTHLFPAKRRVRRAERGGNIKRVQKEYDISGERERDHT